MPPRRVSSFASLDQVTQSTSSGSASNPIDQPQKVTVRSLPSGGRTRGPKRITSLESIPENLGQRNSTSVSRSIALDTNSRPTSVPNRSSSSSGATGGQVMVARAANINRRAVSTFSSQGRNRQILRQGRTYVPPSINSKKMSGTPNNSNSPEKGSPDAGDRRMSNQLDENFWKPNMANEASAEGRYSGGRQGGGRYSGGNTFRRETPQQPPGGTSPPPPQSSGSLPGMQPNTNLPPALRYRSSDAPAGPGDDDNFEGLEIVGRRAGNNDGIHPDIRASSQCSSPDNETTPAPASGPFKDAETRVTRRQNDLPVVVYPHPSTEPERPDLMAKPTHTSGSPKSGPLAIEYNPLEDDEDDWTDEESWKCSDDELADSDEDDSDSDEDFGCIGLFHDDYEDMLRAGKGFNLKFVEEVDNWPVPEEIKNLGYRVIGRLGEEEEGEIGKQFKENRDYKLLRKHGWLHGLTPVDDDDDEWEDECDMF